MKIFRKKHKNKIKWFCKVIYYNGIGDYRRDHLYTPEKYITLMNNSSSDKIDQGIPMPFLDPDNYTENELDALLDWCGGIPQRVIRHCDITVSNRVMRCRKTPPSVIKINREKEDLGQDTPAILLFH